jgi:subtilase family serine protease
VPQCTTANGCFKQVYASGSKPRANCGWAQEAALDIEWAHAMAPNAKIASSGDTGGVNGYPSVSPYVVSAGGTSVKLNANGSLNSETGWSGSGGGPSKYEPVPVWQSGLPNADPTHRSAPDFSFDADPNTGVSVYDSTSCQGLSGWLVFAGTSVSSPSLAGVVNLAGHNYTNPTQELTVIYSNIGTNDFRDIVSGTAGSFSCKSGYDFVTGVGSNIGTSGK